MDHNGNRVRDSSQPSQVQLRDQSDEDSDNDGSSVCSRCCSFLLFVMSILLVIILFPFSMLFTVKVVQQYERAVIFRLGKLLSGGAKGPGLFFILPGVDEYTKVDLRTVSYNIPPQEVLTRDSVTIAVDAVVFYRVNNATDSVNNVTDVKSSTQLLAQTTLRNILGTKSLSQILTERDSISHAIQEHLEEASRRWGVMVERVEIKDVSLPQSMQRSMAAEAEATRNAKAKIIAAEGEEQASLSLKNAADILSKSPAALQIRYLQSLCSVAEEKNSTIIFPLPMEFMSAFTHMKHQQ
ncbi:hypothetical protein HELRODRAFT_185886 [Helobdella robusta]|uniref:Band 7 domain-containing protein n=1 Tax=Helobdella robusta TaxID=6412 RepID=T1FNE4_HELRO|nr:hypothetical protein HELRODRAFT_185886 [Helobdella robusta]ESN97661.1 hypothetical protein HELRODRAFT_185886 [Helobdella robusta]